MNIYQKIIKTYSTIESFPLVIADKLGIINHDVIYHTKDNVHFLARAGTTDIDEIIVIMSGYAYPLDRIPTIHNPVIVDIGTYIGEFCFYASAFYKGNCRILAYEPSKVNLRYLHINKLLNDCSFSVYDKAVSTYKGKAYLCVQNKPADQFSVEKHRLNKSDERCSVVSLADILKDNKIKNIDILKIDIEGMEHELLGDKKTLQILFSSVRYLFIECHDISLEKSTKSILKMLDRSFSILEKRDHVFLLKNSKFK